MIGAAKHLKLVSVLLLTLAAFRAFGETKAVNGCPILLGDQIANASPASVSEMVEDYLRVPADERVLSAQKLKFLDVDGRDVYNISAEFNTSFNGETIRVLLGRVEPRANHDSEVWFFQKVEEGVYEPLAGAMKFIMEDPFFTIVNGELVMGGVETQMNEETGMLGYRTVFYRDRKEGIQSLQAFSAGPWGMKDIRLKQLPDGKIFVATRPQGEIGGRGMVAYTVLNHLSDLNEKNILRARLITGQVPEKQWLGSNEIFLLEDDIGFLSHVAYYKSEETKERGYYVAVFTLKNPRPRIVLIRSDLPSGLSGESKRPDLNDVLFSGGMIRHSDGTATLFVGAGDAEAYIVRIPDPFLNK